MSIIQNIRIKRLTNNYSKKGKLDLKKLDKIMSKFDRYKDAQYIKRNNALVNAASKIDLFLEAEDQAEMARYSYLNWKINDDLSEYKSYATIMRIALKNAKMGNKVLAQIPLIEADATKNREEIISQYKQQYKDAKSLLRMRETESKLKILPYKVDAFESTIHDKIVSIRGLRAITALATASFGLTAASLLIGDAINLGTAVGIMIAVPVLAGFMNYFYRDMKEDLKEINRKVGNIVKREIEKI